MTLRSITVLLFLTVVIPGTLRAQQVTVFATGLIRPHGLVIDPVGTSLYVAQPAANAEVIRVDLQTAEVSPVATGSGLGITIDRSGSRVYIGNVGEIYLMLVPGGPQITWLTSPSFSVITDLVIDSTGQYLFAIDRRNSTIYRVQWHTSDRPAGIYYAVLRVQGMTSVRPMTLLR